MLKVYGSEVAIQAEGEFTIRYPGFKCIAGAGNGI